MRAGVAPWQTSHVLLRCVIVDDDASFLQAARTLLERDGLSVAGVAGSGAEAVLRVAELRPDVVLVDIRLGDESGFEAVRQLAADGRPIALILISTHSQDDYLDLIADSPVAGFIPKSQLSGAAVRGILSTG
jgi:DNA-binding NarL/FixJ family response regulator